MYFQALKGTSTSDATTSNVIIPNVSILYISSVEKTQVYFQILDNTNANLSIHIFIKTNISSTSIVCINTSIFSAYNRYTPI